MKFKNLLFLGIISLLVLAHAEDARVFSAEEILAAQGMVCSAKTFVDIHAHAACLDDGGKTCFVSKRLKKERVALGFIGKYILNTGRISAPPVAQSVQDIQRSASEAIRQIPLTQNTSRAERP